jgi:hypothetical protein
MIGLPLKIQKSIKKSYFPYEICPVTRQKREVSPLRSQQKSIHMRMSGAAETITGFIKKRTDYSP